MTNEEVVVILGAPDSSSLINDKWVMEYSFYDIWEGVIPYYVVFDKDSKRLLAWNKYTIPYEKTSDISGYSSDPMDNMDNGNPAPTEVSGQTIINGIPLTSGQIAQFTQTYGMKPLPGNYWYDNKSGLYGVLGYSSYGFMFPGHNLGTMARNASNGNTGVLVNGRELPQPEWAMWSQMLGSVITPGEYWLDESGNAGNVGNPVPTVNLYTATQNNAYRGSSQGSTDYGSGGGDNFWSSRFSAGNYDSGNQRGYVSVPGYGPIGYGF